MASKTTGFTPDWGLFPPSFRREIVPIDPTKVVSNEKEIKAAADYLIKCFDSFQQQTNITIKGKSMFTNFEKDSLKVISVSDYIFELIVNNQIIVTHLTAEQAQGLKEKQTFLVVCGDAAICCEVITLSNSRINNQMFFVEFEIKRETTNQPN